MNALYITVSIPIFFLLIGVELAWARHRRRQLYRFADSVANLSCGISQQVLGIFLAGAQIALYLLLFEHARLFEVPASSAWAWVGVLLVLDCLYYWFHRASHRVNFLWATHVVHHQSEEYNLSVALRQSALQGMASSFFYLPLAVLGVPPPMFLAAKTINTLYQFWIHTRAIGKLGPLEWVLNTPSHHRIHHAINPKYIDKNYAGMLIVWDRLFGTFVEEEEEEPAYGTVKPLHSWSWLWANVERWVGIARMSARAERLSDKIGAWVRPPEWRPPERGGPVVIPEITRESQVRYESRVPSRTRWWVVANLAAVAAATAFLLVGAEVLSTAQLALLVGVVLATLSAWAGAFEGRGWTAALEIARLSAAVGLGAWIAAS